MQNVIFRGRSLNPRTAETSAGNSAIADSWGDYIRVYSLCILIMFRVLLQMTAEEGRRKEACLLSLAVVVPGSLSFQ